MRTARWGHVVVGAVALSALILQLVLVLVGASVLVPDEDPGLGVRLLRFASYFTIQSNALVALASVQLAVRPARDGSGWRVLRLSGLTAIVVTAAVHWVALRPILDLTGWSAVADTLLHVVVPVLTVAAWLAFGPRPRITWAVVWWSLAFPVAWLVYTLAVGAATSWYPYPFIDVGERGGGAVAVSAAFVTAVVLVVSTILRLIDPRAPRRP